MVDVWSEEVTEIPARQDGRRGVDRLTKWGLWAERDRDIGGFNGGLARCLRSFDS